MIIDNGYHILFYNLFAKQDDINSINNLIKLGLGHILWRGHYHIKPPKLRHEYLMLLKGLCVINAPALTDSSHASDIQANCKVLAASMNEHTYYLLSNSAKYSKHFQQVWTCLHHILQERAKYEYVGDNPKEN